VPVGQAEAVTSGIHSQPKQIGFMCFQTIEHTTLNSAQISVETFQVKPYRYQLSQHVPEEAKGTCYAFYCNFLSGTDDKTYSTVVFSDETTF